MKQTWMILLTCTWMLLGCKDKPAPPPTDVSGPHGELRDHINSPHNQVPAQGEVGAVNPHARAEATPQKPGTGKMGRVVQLLNSVGYSYVEVVNEAGEKTWLALPQLELDVGDELEYPDKLPLVNFESKTLKRTFDRLVFAQGIRVVKCVAGKVHGRAELPVEPGR